jgi:ribose transport system substrate-binding protein
MRRRLLVMAMAATAAIGSVAPVGAAPGGNGHGANFRLAWLANDPSNQYDNAIRAGIEEEAARAHATVDAFFAGFDPGVQLEQCAAALDAGVYAALLIIAADPIAIIPCVEAAHAAGVPVAAVDLPVGPDQTTVEPQVPGVVAASLIPAGEWGTAVSAMVPDVCAGLASCNIFYLAGLLAFPVDQFGLAAAAAAADQSTAINLAGSAEAYYDTGYARDIFAAALDADPTINTVIASGDQMALGAEQAAVAAGRSVRIVGAGAGASALDAVRRGRWHATFNTLPRTEGRLATELLVKALRARPAAPAGVNPVADSGLPVWWTQAALAAHPHFTGEWPGP